MRIRRSRSVIWIAQMQGTYYLLTGLWPLLHIESFQRVTGRKTDNLPTGLAEDHWLVVTVSLLLISIALAIFFGTWSRRVNLSLPVLGLSAAFSLLIVDCLYSLRGVIAPVYLVDAMVELIFILGWLTALRIGRDRPGVSV